MTEEEFRSGKGVEHHFDYMAECDKTCSTVFRPEQVEVDDMRHVLTSIAGFAEDLNVIKKLLFRGKTREELNFGPAVKPTLDDVVDKTNGHPGFVDILHGAVGAITEAGEVAEYLLAWLDSGKFDAVNVAEESGDMLWYIVRSMRGIGMTLAQCERMNIDKLRGRHGETFDVFRDANRDLVAERGKLEDNFGEAPTLFEGVDVIKNPDLDPVNASFHAKGVEAVKEAHGEMSDMVDKIKAANNADIVGTRR